MNPIHHDPITDRKESSLPPLPSDFVRGVCELPHLLDVERLAFHVRGRVLMCEEHAYEFDREEPIRAAFASAAGMDVYDVTRDEAIMLAGEAA